MTKREDLPQAVVDRMRSEIDAAIDAVAEANTFAWHALRPRGHVVTDSNVRSDGVTCSKCGKTWSPPYDHEAVRGVPCEDSSAA